MTLNCWVRGYEINRISSVDISSTKTVTTLREVIKDKKPVDFRDIDADALVLYKVSLPCNGNLDQSLKDLKLDIRQALHPWRPLSQVFLDPPLQEHLHVVIETPRFSHGESHVGLVCSSFPFGPFLIT